MDIFLPFFEEGVNATKFLVLELVRWSDGTQQ